MAINLDLIKSKLNQLQKQTTKQTNIWKPEPGTHQIRIVPYKHNKENPFIELLFHYDIGKKIYLSPASFGKADPIVEFAEKLKTSGNSDEWRMGKKLEPKMRTYVPILVRGKENEGVKFWGFGKSVYSELLSFMVDPDYGDITDPKAGRDITVEFIAAEKPGAYPKTQIRVKPNTTPITADPDVINLIKEQPTITDLFNEPTYEELRTALENWMNPENTATAGDEDTESETAAPAKSTGVKDVSAAFDSLFNS